VPDSLDLGERDGWGEAHERENITTPETTPMPKPTAKIFDQEKKSSR
jgi:hypothetical protein